MFDPMNINGKNASQWEIEARASAYAARDQWEARAHEYKRQMYFWRRVATIGGALIFALILGLLK